MTSKQSVIASIQYLRVDVHDREWRFVSGTDSTQYPMMGCPSALLRLINARITNMSVCLPEYFHQ